MKENSAPKTILRAEYSPPAFTIKSVQLDVDLKPGNTTVTSLCHVLRTAAAAPNAALVLDGVDLELLSISINDEVLDSDAYSVSEDGLSIATELDEFQLSTVTRIHPEQNKALEGLYQSGGSYCTQCEAQGFRKITWFLDRPDVLATFDVTIHADKSRYPVLLANGNQVDSGDEENGRHWARWQDPFPKPSYLFALVAGDLEHIADTFVTASGRQIDLLIYVEAHNLHKCDYAMRALINSMRWDEEVFGLEYDLDIFMIVAVDDFNMGAMENKGLNIFNSKYVLADQRTATDADFMGVEAVVAHEYFHNWTGNRVTCRDWFQLSLKEGLTVFRDQQFSGDMNSHAVKRIEDVRLLRAYQFAEDAGPMAHPIRPDEYIEINNFYTVTVYEKGAEVIRMIHTLLGADRFRRGMDLYFERHDGHAVTCDDFVAAMEDAGGVDLVQFRHWYSQAGTPKLTISSRFDAQAGRYYLDIQQSCGATPGQAQKPAFHIPLRLSLLDAEGKPIPLISEALSLDGAVEAVVDIRAETQTLEFDAIESAPVPSLLRGFSAPVLLDYDYQCEELAFLMAHDSDPFNRWEACQRLGRLVIERAMNSVSADEQEAFHDAFAALLTDASDPAFLAEAMQLPGIESVAAQHAIVAVDEIHAARQQLLRSLATSNNERLLDLYHHFYAGETTGASKEFRIDAESIGARSLANACLRLLSANPHGVGVELAQTQFESAGNMSDMVGALRVLIDTEAPSRDDCLEAFYQRWHEDKLVTDKWFSMQAVSQADDCIQRVKSLMQHPAFTLSNPNRIRSLIGAFASGNPLRFHDAGGAGYQLLADTVITLDADNPQVAARLVNPLSRWQRYDANRKSLMQAQLSRIAEQPSLSPDVFEIVSKSLAATENSADSA